MKHDLSSIIVKNLQDIYGLKGEGEGYLYKYLYIRTAIHLNKRKVSNNEMFKQVIRDLNIDTFFEDNSRYLEYHEERYPLINVVSPLFDNLKFRAEMEGVHDFEVELEDIFRKGYQRAYKLRRTPAFNVSRDYNRLLLLNSELGANPISSAGVDGFKKDVNHNPMKRTSEEEMEAKLTAKRHSNTNTVAYISEGDLENFLVNNLDKVEKGMKFLRQQMTVTGGVIDIVARDKDDNICVIEIKVSEDKSIIWQALHYQSEAKRKYNTGDVRMITLAPSYSKAIEASLRAIPGVELMSYNVNVENGEVVDIFVKEE